MAGLGEMFANLPQYGVQPPGATPDAALTVEEVLLAVEADGAESVHVIPKTDEVEIQAKFSHEVRIYSVAPSGVFLRTEELIANS